MSDDFAAGMRRAAEIAQGFMREHGGSLTDARSTLPQRIHNAILAAIPPAAPWTPPFEFDRYINGVLMAEGVTIERETTIQNAAKVAARIASRGPNGEPPVLVYRPAPEAQP